MIQLGLKELPDRFIESSKLKLPLENKSTILELILNLILLYINKLNFYKNIIKIKKIFV